MYRRIAIGVVALLLVPVGVATASDAPASDPYRSRQWGLDKIQAEQAWTAADGGGTVIAIVDTGVDFQHEDLASKVVYYADADFVEPRGTCTARRDGRRVCKQDGAQDRHGHGTNVAGVAAAVTQNGVGISGAAPGALILPVRVISGDAKGGGSVQAVADGIEYAVDKGADVINLSLAYDPSSNPFGEGDEIYDAIDYAWSEGAVVVVAAGNGSGAACAGPFEHPEILCVGATDPRDFRTYYSGTDATQSQDFLVAPGGSDVNCASGILTTALTSARPDECAPAAGYAVVAGTSLAAPFVSGTAALLAGHGLTNDVIVDCLLRNTDDLGVPGRDSLYGYGRLNAAKVVDACL